MRWALLFLGGGGGAVARALLSGWVTGRSASGFPWGTLTVNVLGCLAIGFVFEWMAMRGALQPETRALIITGFLGGFTTFSTFGQETVDLVSRGETTAAALNVMGSLVLGFGAVLLGGFAMRSLG